ncbi:hypothetical protein [Novosphingobium sp. JCM 18896]|uniref:hypothetical protein n=1 Tax=Novosphingobium sp. JCM 18896 TaxID=2989731 RepID=UPI002223371A|nr:hypothetical protein [Novosphingobium sp. JCM 18896]MCW1432408.1 hypothetical protein [Novosphingobium sp. JCM 18896]
MGNTDGVCENQPPRALMEAAVLAQLPMQFRGPLPDEALMGYVSECASQYCAHPAGLLELAGCPPSLERVPFVERHDSDRLAHLLSQPSEDFAALTYQRVHASPRRLKFVSFNEVTLRRSHLLASRRRLSPAAMRNSNHVRALALVEAIGFCPETWTALTDRCLACGKPLTWPNLDHVSHCHHCGADQRHYETARIPEHLHEALTFWTGLVHPLAERQVEAASRLPEKLQVLSQGEVFELVLGLADALNPGMSRIEAIGPAVEVIMGWPGSVIAELEADNARSNGIGPTLSSRLRRFAQQGTTLPAVRSLLLHDLARDRGCALGTKAELKADLRRINGLSVRQAGEHLGLAPSEVIVLRRAGIVQAESVTRGRTSRALLTMSSCEQTRMDLADRMPVQEFMHITGLSLHAVDELIDGGHLERRQNSAIDALYGSVVLRRSKAEDFIRNLRSEPPRACRRPFGLNYAAMGVSSSMA